MPNVKIPRSFYNNMISFPFHIHMSDKNFDYMVESVKKCIQDLKNN